MMEKNNREYDKKKLEKLMKEFPLAYVQYLNDSIDEAQNAKTDEEFDRIVDARLTREQFFIEYMLENGIIFERVGSWICGDDDQDSWTCSECGFPVMPADYDCDPYEAEIEYCEKCGARMVNSKK